MPDSPDYSKYRVSSVRVSMSDMGELAARLGAVQRLYRDGTVITYDDFRHGFASCSLLPGGAGSAISLVSQQTFTGAYQAKLLCGTGAGANAAIDYVFSTILTGRTGVEACFAIEDTIDNFEILVTLSFALSSVDIRIRLDFLTNTVRYYGSDGAYHDLGGIPIIDGSGGVIHFMKLTFDTDKSEYVKFTLDDLSADMTGIACRLSAGVFIPQKEFKFQLDGRTGFNSIVYINHVIITADEP